MNTQKDPLGLSDLPAIDPPEDGWSEIEAQLKVDHQRRERWKSAGASLAIAAGFMLAIGLVLLQPWQTSPVGPETGPAVAENSGSVEPEMSPDVLVSLIDLSQRLETQLRASRSQLPSLSTTSTIYRVELEDMVAQVDEELSLYPESTELWRQRVNLMIDLTNLYRTELRREHVRLASL